jgi:hypothetical protein
MILEAALLRVIPIIIQKKICLIEVIHPAYGFTGSLYEAKDNMLRLLTATNR